MYGPVADALWLQGSALLTLCLFVSGKQKKQKSQSIPAKDEHNMPSLSRVHRTETHTVLRVATHTFTNLAKCRCSQLPPCSTLERHLGGLACVSRTSPPGVWRSVSRGLWTARLLFDRINLEPKIQIKYIDTKNHLADMLTKERVEPSSLFVQLDEFLGVLLQPLHIILLLRSESRTPCHDKEVKKRVPVKVLRRRNQNQSFLRRRDPSIWFLRGPWSARAKPPKDLGYLVDPKNADEGTRLSDQHKKTCTDNPKPRSPMFSTEATGNHSKCRLLETKPRQKTSNITTTRKFARAVNTKKRFQNMKYINNQYMKKVFTFLQKLRITTRYPTTSSKGASETNMLILRMCMSSSMKAAIHLGPTFLANLELYKNTNFEEIQSIFNIIKKIILEHSEEIRNVQTIHNTSPSWTRSVLSDDTVIQWTKAKLLVYSISVLYLGK